MEVTTNMPKFRSYGWKNLQHEVRLNYLKKR